jgi:branched-chain amino acid transport system permease protein
VTYAVTALYGLAFGLLLFTVAAGLTLIFGVLDVLNLAHGSLYLAGAYLAYLLAGGGGLLDLAIAFAAGVAVGAGGGFLLAAMLRPLAGGGHLDQALATLGIAWIAADAYTAGFGGAPLPANPPDLLAGSIRLGAHGYPIYRLGCIVLTFLLAWVARNLTRGRIGRSWMAIRDMDIAAEIIGVSPLKAKLSAFAVSSFFVGVAGALYFAVYFGAVEVTDAFGIRVSFLVLFMIIIGGLGSIFGSFAGAAFMVLMPILLKNVMVGTLGWPTDLAAHVEIMLVGVLIVFFLIVEPHGLNQLWRLTKEKLRLWPFPH